MKCVYCQGYGFTDFKECDHCRGTGEAQVPPKLYGKTATMIIVDEPPEDVPGDCWNADAD